MRKFLYVKQLYEAGINPNSDTGRRIINLLLMEDEISSEALSINVIGGAQGLLEGIAKTGAYREAFDEIKNNVKWIRFCEHIGRDPKKSRLTYD